METIKEIIKKNNGITLIALVITIIILLILAGVTIIALGGENGLITKTKQAQIEHEKAQAKEELQMKIYQLQIKIINEESREATLEDFNNMIKEDVDLTFISASYKTAATETVEGNFETIKVLYSKYIFTVDEYLQIIDVESNETIADVKLTYEVKEMQEYEEKIVYNTLITLKGQEKITKVEYGEQILYSDTGEEEIGIDYTIEKGKEYIFKVTLASGKEVEKTFIINRVPITKLTVTETLVMGQGLNKKITVNTEPSFADVGKITYTSSDESIATVNGEGNITGINLGNTIITVKEEYSSLEVTCNVNIIKLDAGIKAANGKIYAYSSLDNKLNIVNSSGNITKSIELEQFGIQQIAGEHDHFLILDSNNHIRTITGEGEISDILFNDVEFKMIAGSDYSDSSVGAIDVNGNIWYGDTVEKMSMLTNTENNGGIKYKYISVSKYWDKISAIDEDGKLWLKGNGYYIDSTNSKGYSALTKVETDNTMTNSIFKNSKFKKTISAYIDSIFLDEKGNLWTLGSNGGYGAGDGTNKPTGPKILAGPDSDGQYKTEIIDIELNTYYGMAIDKNGDIYTWGRISTDAGGNRQICKIEIKENNEKVKFRNISCNYYSGPAYSAVSTEGYLYLNVYQSFGVVQAKKTAIKIY